VLAERRRRLGQIRVIIVDDDLNWLKAMTNFLNMEQDIFVVGMATIKEEALELVQKSNAEVILMDINLTGNRLDGIEATEEILKLKKIKIITLTCLDEEKVIIDSFNAGAVNFVAKHDYKQIPHAIRAAYNHSSSIEVLLGEYAKLKKEKQLRQLTFAEREIVEMLEKNYTRKKIAEKLHKAESTIKNQIKSIFKKLGVDNRDEAIEKLKNAGL
jgi:NarL family two-component system response regulator LiaR